VDEYLALNRAMWDERAPAHAASPDYGVERYVADPTHLSDVVSFDRPRLGDLTGLRGAHLQCHIGTDTLSLARLGARMTGLDLSPVSLAQARRLATDAGADVEYVEADTYSAPAALDGRTFDLVYTGVGALCWLPDVARWAQVVVDLLRPGGRLFIREGHPVLWSLAYDRADDLLVLEYPYVERPEPDLDDTDGTYVETEATFTANRSYSWNHGLGEIVTALLDRGMRITMLVEHDSVPWDPFDRATFERIGGGEYRLADRPWRLPHTYTLQAVKG